MSDADLRAAGVTVVHEISELPGRVLENGRVLEASIHGPKIAGDVVFQAARAEVPRYSTPLLHTKCSPFTADGHLGWTTLLFGGVARETYRDRRVYHIDADRETAGVLAQVASLIVSNGLVVPEVGRVSDLPDELENNPGAAIVILPSNVDADDLRALLGDSTLPLLVLCGRELSPVPEKTVEIIIKDGWFPDNDLIGRTIQSAHQTKAGLLALSRDFFTIHRGIAPGSFATVIQPMVTWACNTTSQTRKAA
jgi:hypothetical protein